MEVAAIPEGWEKLIAEQIAAPEPRSIVSGPFGSSIGSRFFVDEGVPVIRGNNLSFGETYFRDSGFVFLTHDKAAEFRNCRAAPEDLVFTAAGTLGQVGLIPKTSRFPYYIISNKQLRLRVDTSRCDPTFLFYWFTQPTMREHIKQSNRGSSVPLITLGVLRNLPVLLPPLETQRRIASILGAYDDLIDVNRRRVGALEEMARRLFEEWFVRFRFPEHQSVPVIETSEGELPEGWEFACIGDLGAIITGKTPSKAAREHFGQDVPFIKIPDMHSGIFVHETGEMLSSEGAASQRNKTIPTGALCVSCIGTIGLVAITTELCQTNQQINAVVPKGPEWTEFLYFSLRRLKPHLINLGSTGATMGNVNKQKFSAVRLPCPPSGLLDVFHTRASSMLMLIQNAELANRRLLASRDLLLPRLVSGQLSVANAERVLEEVA